jgi:hypothetical protein
VSRVKYAMDYRPRNSFSMSYASRKVIFPGESTVAYLNATRNVKSETRNRRLEPTGLAKPVETRVLMGTCMGLARHESAGRVIGQVWNRTDPFLLSKPGPVTNTNCEMSRIVIDTGVSDAYFSVAESQGRMHSKI